ncbi:MAG: hypothetical protein K2K92_08730 [Duncaniella sp.]|nr:hypothetical protein [Duncaniella sp.]
MKSLSFILLTATLLGLTACSKKEKSKLMEPEVYEHLSTIYSDDELNRLIRNNDILIRHIVINDDSISYRLDISEDEAIKLGVEKEFYDAVVENIKSSNESIKKGLDEGMEIELMDFQKYIKERENQ